MVPTASRTLAFLFALFLVTSSLAAQQPTQPPEDQTQVTKGEFFPYTIYSRTLANGLPVIVIPTPEFKDMVTFATPVFAGSRNETERGKTGLAHLFEHIMFRHEYKGEPGGYDEQIRRMGAHNNAWTSYDMTFYHPTTFTSNLVGPIPRPGADVDGLITLEADRFQHLTVDKKTFQTEAGAVLGEYRRIFSFPSEKMIEEMSPVAFPHHPYGHTVIGYYDDVKDMPNAWDAAWEFFRNYYHPGNVALVVVGDVQPEMIFREVEKSYLDWKARPMPKIPEPSPPDGPKDIHVDWEADVAPRISVAYRTPAFHPATKESAVTLLLQELLVSRSAPLFQKLRYEKQTVTGLGLADTPESTDPHLLNVEAEMMLDRFRQQGKSYVDDVEKDIIQGIEALQNFSQQPDAAKTLEVVKSKVRNDFLGQLSSTGDIAQTFAWYYRFDHRPDVIDELARSLAGLTPADIDAYARRYFQPKGRYVTTLWKQQEEKSQSSKEGK